MPSIAQQDYLKIEGDGSNDCRLLAGLAAAIERGTIFDIILNPDIEARPAEYEIRILGVYRGDDGHLISFLDPEDASFNTLQIKHTAIQYSGLAAIQQATQTYGIVPELTYNEGNVLFENNASVYLLCGGKCLVVDFDNNATITAVRKSELDPPQGEDTAEISFEDAQKLIGIQLA